MARIAKAAKGDDVRMDYYGKVVDQSGQPVAGVEMEISMDRYSPASWTGNQRIDLKMETDAKGCFKLRGERGNHIYIGPLKKKGYEDLRGENLKINSISYFKIPPDEHVYYKISNNTKGKDQFLADPNNPLVYHLRKKGEGTFVLKSETWFIFKPAGPTQGGWDIVADHRVEEKELAQRESQQRGKPWQPYLADLRVKTAFDPKTKIWTVVLISDFDMNGIIPSDQLLYEAPATGYQPSYTFTVDPSKTYRNENSADEMFAGKYLYLKSCGVMPLYSRIHLDKIVKEIRTERGELRISFSAVLNPYGDRNLEEATDLPWPVFRAVRDEAEQAYRRGNRPTKPDLAQRVREWEKSRPLADKVKDWLKK